jgi:hypothetical protein
LCCSEPAREPWKGTQGKAMNRKTWIALALVLAGALSASLPAVAFAGSPVLSGYGGPGAGEQTILGSTLIGGSGGGSGSGGSSRPGGSSGSVQEGSSRSVTGGSGSASANDSPGTAPGGSSGAGAGSSGGLGPHGGASAHRRGAPQANDKANSPTHAAVSGVYVYPSSLRLASADSSVLAISGGDLLLLIATIAVLAVLGVITTRLSRLQR